MKSDTYKQYSVLTMNTVAFAANFAVWTMFAVIGVRIKSTLGLNETEFGILVATPILTGSLTRLPLGILTDRFGGRIVFTAQMLLTAAACFGLTFATSYWHYLGTGLLVGLAGGSFAIGIAYTSAWFDKAHQGTAMGIFGAGNAGAAITNLVAPMILVTLGWQAVPRIYAIALVIMAVVFWLFTYDDPKHAERKRSGAHLTLGTQLAPVARLQVWRFGLYYFFVFGGFVSLALWLPKYYVTEYGLGLGTASLITMVFTLPSGLVRALGGWLSDRFGARAVNWGVFWVCLVCLFFLSYPQTTMTIHGIEGDVSLAVGLNVWVFTVLVFVVGMSMGVGKASVYRLIADYYPDNVGSVGGLVGVLGGLGGFFLPIAYGIAADLIGVRSSAFMVLYAFVAASMIWMFFAIRRLEAMKQLDEAAEGATQGGRKPATGRAYSPA
ncbi:MAG TPA: nitrate/nitrite transporter [Gammaproteobacteria bacterium]|nr:nitrate/nitrite transporter [Gammaproteobacteria bacterium]